ARTAARLRARGRGARRRRSGGGRRRAVSHRARGPRVPGRADPPRPRRHGPRARRILRRTGAGAEIRVSTSAHDAALERGFAALRVADEDRARALQNLAEWRSGAAFADYRPQLEAMIAAGRFEDLLDSFFRVLPFGTGGRRGPVGIGTNRFNPFTLASSVQGHAEFLRRYEPGDDHSVVVVYDVRRFSDLREVYNPKLSS